MRARERTFAADDAPVRGENQLVFRLQRFGVLAPLATQRAPFEKNSRPYSRAVMDRKTLDVAY